MSDDKKVVPITDGIKPGEVVAEVGGLVDESKITLALYGEDLDPDQVTELLGVAPTSAHRKGDRRGHRSPRYKKGAWFLKVAGSPPVGPEELIGTLLTRLPAATSPVWEDLRSRFELQLRFGLFLTGWNCGFGLRPEIVERLGKIGCRFEFDIYADEGEDA